MIVYNLTVKVHHSILEGWLAWVQQDHIPAALTTGAFDDYKFYRLLEQDEAEGPTFVLQYYTPTAERCQRYIRESAPKLQQEALDKWGGAFITFSTIMEELC
jgi:hypothetical protein